MPITLEEITILMNVVEKYGGENLQTRFPLSPIVRSFVGASR